MIEYMKPTDSIFDSGAQALVCPVNCVGVMEAGLALEFKKMFPKYAESYHKAAISNSIVLGGVHGYKAYDNYFLSVATIFHWREKSNIASIERGAKGLARLAKYNSINSIAIPALGCGLDGLDWSDVRPFIEEAFKYLTDVRVMLYPPKEDRA